MRNDKNKTCIERISDILTGNKFLLSQNIQTRALKNPTQDIKHFMLYES